MSALDEPSTISPYFAHGQVRLRQKLPPAPPPIDHWKRWTNVGILALLGADLGLIAYVAITLLQIVR